LATSCFRFCRFPEIKTLEDNERFCSFLRTLLDEQCVYVASLDHYPRLRSAVIIPNLSLGLSLASPHLSPDQLDAFMRRMLVSRISRRVLAEHHIALSDSVAGRDHGSSEEERHVGIIYTGLNVEKSVRRCTALLHQLTHDSDAPEYGRDIRWPKVVIEGHAGTQFAYIREHLESALSSSVLTFLLIVAQIHYLRAIEECALAVLCTVAAVDRPYVHIGHASYNYQTRSKVGPS
jgi:pyruvate dehydrogenase kinase 2/3/4